MEREKDRQSDVKEKKNSFAAALFVISCHRFNVVPAASASSHNTASLTPFLPPSIITIFFYLFSFVSLLSSSSVLRCYSFVLSDSLIVFFSFPKEERCEIVLNTWYTRLISFLESSTHLSIHPSFHP